VLTKNSKTPNFLLFNKIPKTPTSFHSGTWRFVWFINGEPPDPPVRRSNYRDGGAELSGGNHRRDRLGKEHPALSDAASERLHQIWNRRRHSAPPSRSSLRCEVEFQCYNVILGVLGLLNAKNKKEDDYDSIAYRRF